MFFSLVLYSTDFVVLLVYFFSVRQSVYVRLCFSTDSYRHMHTDTQPYIQTAFTHACTNRHTYALKWQLPNK